MSFHSYKIWNILTFLKVRKFQNENMESSHCPKYERIFFLNLQNFTIFFVHVLGNATTSYFHFEIYWHLPKGRLLSHKYSFFCSDFFKKQSLAFSRKKINPLGSKSFIVICIRGEISLKMEWGRVKECCHATPTSFKISLAQL